MSESFIQLPPDSTGKLLRTEQLTVGSNVTQQEVVVIGDPTTSTSLASVDSNGHITSNISDGTSNIIGTNAHPVRIDPTGTTIQPVSGTVTSNIGSTGGLALDATLSGAQVVGGGTTAPSFVRMVGGKTNDATAQYDIIPLGAGGRSLIIEGIAGGTAVPVSLASAPTTSVTQGTSPWVVGQSTAANLNATVVGTGTFAVQATLAAETTKVIGTVNQGTSPWTISGAVTEASIDAALISQETTTSGVKGLTAFGAVTTNAPSYSTTKSDALSLDTSGLLRISLKDTPQNTTAFKVDGSGVTQPVSLTSTTITGTVAVTQSTAAATTAGWPTINGTVARSTATWTSATSNNTALSITTTGYGSVAVTINTTTTITGGTLNFEVSDDAGTTWFPVAVNDANVYTSQSTYVLLANTLQAFEGDVGAFNAFRVRLSPAITGSGQVVIGISGFSGATEPSVTVGQSVAGQLNATVVGTGTFAVQDGSDMTGTVPGTAPSLTSIVGGIHNTAAPSPTNGQTVPLQVDGSANLMVDIAAAASSVTAVGATGSAVPSAAGYNGYNSGGNLVGVSTANPFPIQTVPTTGVAANALNAKTIVSTASTAIKATAGTFYGIQMINLATTTSTPHYIHFFNASNTTGVTTGNWQFLLPIPTNTTASDIGQGTLSIPPGAFGLFNFSTGIAIVINTTSTSNTTASGVNPAGTIWYL